MVVVAIRSSLCFAPSLVFWNDWCGFDRNAPIPLGSRGILVQLYWVFFNGGLEDVNLCDGFSNGEPQTALVKPLLEQILGLRLFATVSDFREFCMVFSSS